MLRRVARKSAPRRNIPEDSILNIIIYYIIMDVIYLINFRYKLYICITWIIHQ
jgi:hypothetical protein